MERRRQTKGAGDAPVGRARSPLYKGLEKVTISFDPAQADRLRKEALQRAAERGDRPDMSAIVREALDAYWGVKGSRK